MAKNDGNRLQGKNVMNEIQLNRRFFASIAASMPPIESRMKKFWNDNPSILQNYLMGLQLPPTNNLVRTFRTFKIIKIDDGLQGADDVKSATEKSGGKVSDIVYKLINQLGFKIPKQEQNLECVIASVKDLGLGDEASLPEIMKRAKALGLGRRYHEAGPQPAEQYAEQSNNEVLIIAMNPVTGASRDSELFYVENRSDGCWLYVSNGRLDDQ